MNFGSVFIKQKGMQVQVDIRLRDEFLDDLEKLIHKYQPHHEKDNRVSKSISFLNGYLGLCLSNSFRDIDKINNDMLTLVRKKSDNDIF